MVKVNPAPLNCAPPTFTSLILTTRILFTPTTFKSAILHPIPTSLVTQSEVAGEVVKILVENGTPVTPGMPLMIIKP